MWQLFEQVISGSAMGVVGAATLTLLGVAALNPLSLGIGAVAGILVCVDTGR